MTQVLRKAVAVEVSSDEDRTVIVEVLKAVPADSEENPRLELGKEVEELAEAERQLKEMTHAVIYAEFAKEHKGWEERVANGDLAFVVDWLRKNVHQHGRRYTAGQLVKRITGSPLKSEAHTNYLSRKYEGLYS